eukprot:s2727_g5.t2
MSVVSPGDRGITTLAYDLHRSVPPDRWCVTYWDLVFLRQEVQSALRCGEIQPGPEDDVSEDYGPSIYTVNEQYIKPVTQDAGKMSWALMRNPDGLQCDLFISHAWQEGVFEFLAKVRHSWPRSVQTAWCCMLANPRNLDIASFLQSPKSSPFAIALQASKVMLVVPNRQESVYTRLWCAYEAYLAQEEGKTILIARSSNLHELLGVFNSMALAAALGAAVGMLATAWHIGIPYKVTRGVHLFYWIMTSLACCAADVDRINARSTLSEAAELRNGYRGMDEAPQRKSLS